MIAANLAESHRKFGFIIKLTLLIAFLNGHRFCTSNGMVTFEVATNRMDYNALPAGCRIISCRPLWLELTSSEPMTLDKEVCMQEEWHRDERKCTLVILARDLLLLDLISLMTTGLPSPLRHHRAFRRHSVAVTPSITLALAPPIVCHRRAVRRRRHVATPPTRRRQAPIDVA
jgi:hypothetical protein